MARTAHPLQALPLLLLAPCVGCGPSAPSATPSPSAGRPDVFLFVIDTLRADRLGCYGYPRPTSPRLDRLAEEGVLFEDVTAQCSWTQPSMVSLFTGKYLTAYRDVFEADDVPLAQAFQAAGYHTLGVVGNVLLSNEQGFDRGFDSYSDRTATGFERHYTMIGRATEDLIRWLRFPLERAVRKRKKGEHTPLFVYVHAMDPHDKYLAHPRFNRDLPPQEILDVPADGWERQIHAEEGAAATDDDPDWEESWKTIQWGRAHYDHEIRYTDAMLGEFLDELEENGLLDNAIVAVVADHGEGLWQRVVHAPPEELAQLPPEKFFFKTHGHELYQELLATPFLLWGRGVPEGVRVREPIENVDLYPTLMQLCDMGPPAELHGRSLVDLMHGRESAAKDSVHAFVHHQSTVRETATNLKLVLPVDGGELGRAPRLFSLSEDPEELHDLAAERPDDVKRLTERIEAWRAAHPTNDSFAFPKGPETTEHLKALGYLND